MLKKTSSLLCIVVILALMLPAAASAQPASFPAVPVTFTVLHTNDIHGNMEFQSGGSTSNPGLARLAKVVNDTRTSVGAANVLVVDAGDEMQGSLLSNLKKGEPMIAVLNAIGYNVATFGNHEFDWGQDTLVARTTQAAYPYVSANIVSGPCDGWTPPSFAQPYYIQTVGVAPNTVKVGFIGVTTTETPSITIASATSGLCFKDPAESIIHYYDTVKSQADVVIVLSHLGYTDGGYGYGLPVYGDQTLAQKLIDAGKTVPLIIGGHSHTKITPPAVVVGGKTTVVQAYYNARELGRADVTVKTDGSTTVVWSKTTVPTGTDSALADPTIASLISTYTSDPTYQAMIGEEIGWTNVPLIRDYNGDNLMGSFINDAIYNDLNTDGIAANDVDMVFNNAGGLRADIACAAPPCLLTYGSLFSVLPFGNATAIGNMTGAQIMELLNQSALLTKGSIQVAGIRFKFFNYMGGTPARTYAWGAFDVCVLDKSDGQCDPLDMAKTYKVATNEFLAPAGQDGFVPFKYMTNITYWGDMLLSVNRWVKNTYTASNPYNGALDGRITRDGNSTGGSIIPITILHHNDSHGNIAKGTYVGYTQLATLIKQERAYNPTRTILLNGGDSIQGDAMSYYFKTAPTGFAVDGTPLPDPLKIDPVIAQYNAMGYDAMTLGNHEFNFGKDVFTSVLSQANFPLMMANVSDDGSYGLAAVNVKPYIEKTIGAEGIKVAIMGIGNHRVPNYELPSNIPGLTFSNPIEKAQELANQLRPVDDVVLALTHIGFTTDPKSVEVDTNVDTNMAAQVTGLDAIIGSHSHTNPAYGFGNYKYLPTIVGGPNNTPVIINHAYRYNNTLGEIIIGVRPKAGGGFEVVSRAGTYLTVSSSVAEDPAIKAISDPYVTMLNAYNGKVLGTTTTPVDARTAFVEETSGANIQADASVAKLQSQGIPVDFHLSGAMTNKGVALTGPYPFTLKVSDMFTLMPYENSLVVLQMNGPQLKTVLERAYRNYYYYKYVSGYGGYSYYTTCMLDTNKGNVITYNDVNPELPNGHNVVSLKIGDNFVDFNDADTFYNVSTVNYLAAGSCNFNDAGVTLWPLSQIVADTQNYVRDVVIDYITAQGTVAPVVEGRLSFISDKDAPTITINAPTSKVYLPTDTLTIDFTVEDTVSGVKSAVATLDGNEVANGDVIDLTALADGEHTFKVVAEDNASNQGTEKVKFHYDSVGPVITITAPEAKAYTHPEKLTLNFSAVDEGSGVASLVAKLDGTDVTNGQVIDLLTLALGDHTFDVKAVDNSGFESTSTVTFSVTATKTSLVDSLNRFFTEGKIDNQGILNSLLAKLQQKPTDKKGGTNPLANQLRAFINEVQAQRGKHVTIEAADLLLADAHWVLDHLQ